MREQLKKLMLCSGVTVAIALIATPALASGRPSPKPTDDGGGTAQPISMQESELPGQVWGDIRSEGQIAIGFRGVSQGGSESRYSKDIDLDSGVRILDTHWVLSPASREAGSWFDRAVINVNGAGGDPYENYGVSLNKTGKYRFDARTRKADFKWGVTGGHNHWDVTRWDTDVKLSVTPVKQLEVYGIYKDYRQNGDSIVSRDISRNEFELDGPVDQTSQSWTVGARYSRNATSVFFDQEFYQFKNNVSLLSGPNSGLEPDGANLIFLEEKEVRAIDAPITRAGVDTRIAGGRVHINGDILASKQSLAFVQDRFWDGRNFQQRPLAAQESALGDAEREILHANASVGFQVSNRANVRVKYRRRGWDQDGGNIASETQLFQDGSTSYGVDRLMSSYEITDNQFLVGGEGLFRGGVAYAEIGYSARDQTFDNEATGIDAADTRTLAFRVGGTYRPSRVVDLKVGYDYGDIDDPFTRISPTRVNKFRIRVNSRPVDGLVVGGHFTNRDIENTMTLYTLKQRGFGVHTNYSWGPASWATFGYTRNKLDSEIPVTFIFPFFGNPTNSTALLDLADNVLTAATDFVVSNSVPLGLYGSVSYVTSSSDEAGIPTAKPVAVVRLDYYDLIFGGRYTFPRGWFVDLQGRFIDYRDDGDLPSAVVDDYDAKIFTAALGIRF